MSESDTISKQPDSAQKLKTTKNLWFPISEFDPKTYNFEPMMIASRELIDPIINPQGAGFAWYHHGNDEFIVSVADLENPGVHAVAMSRKNVTHFIVVEGPY